MDRRRCLARAAHDARYGHCAHCGISLIEQFGTDGPIIVSMGWCNTCGVVTSWGIVVAD